MSSTPAMVEDEFLNDAVTVLGTPYVTCRMVHRVGKSSDIDGCDEYGSQTRWNDLLSVRKIGQVKKTDETNLPSMPLLPCKYCIAKFHDGNEVSGCGSCFGEIHHMQRLFCNIYLSFKGRCQGQD